VIRSISLKNFLSYRDVLVDMTGSTVAVTGDNGVGKSSLLEAIPYVYFGIGRETMEGMSRIKGDGSHDVILTEDNGVEIRRGRKKGGTGYFNVRKDGELVAKGDDAKVWVKNHLGMDGDTFMLTAFFGLQDVRHDTLIRVTPANRLEALQKLAEIGPYKKLLASAKSKFSAAESVKKMAESKKEGAEAGLVNEEATKSLIKICEADIEKSSQQHLALKSKKDLLLIEEEKYQAFLKEKSELSVERRTIDCDIKRLEEELEDLNENLLDLTEVSTDSIKERDGLKKPKITPTEEAVKIGELHKAIGAASGRGDLLNKVIDSESTVNECPLCAAPVADNQIELWRAEIVTLRKQYKKDKESIKIRSDQVTEYNRVVVKMSELKTLIDDAVVSAKKDNARVIVVNSELRKLQSNKTIKDNRFIDLQEKLGDAYQKLHKDIEDISDQIEGVVSDISASNSAIKVHRISLKSNLTVKGVLRDCDVNIKISRKDMRAAKLLIDAWNRYGIPMRLIKDTMVQIEEIATTIYQEFDSGRISVIEVEDRGKPGVEFKLQDCKGDRTFNQLSEGEKVMFYIAVRVAISQIIRDFREVTVDYLILDEAMGNLSPKRRDDLVRLINKSLRKMFPAVLMVSHTEMRDIFSKTLRVSADSGDSIVEVVV
jgi:DNA repair exonuclease SbcCD ATPase subunit